MYLMTARTRSTALATLLVLACALSAFAQDAADVSQQYIQAHERARQLFGQPQRLISHWHEFAERHQDHSLGRVARLNQALCMLQRAFDDGSADEEEVRRDVLDLLDALVLPQSSATEAQAPDSSLPAGLGDESDIDDDYSTITLDELVHAAALGLRTHIELAELAEHLQDHYRRHIEYPQSLEVLVEAELIAESRLIDPFGEPYHYAARPRSFIPDIPRQSYTLRSESMEAEPGQLRELIDWLDKPIENLEISTLAPDERRAYLRQRRPDGSWTSARSWRVGQQRTGVRLWAVYDDYLLIVRDNIVPQIITAEPR